VLADCIEQNPTLFRAQAHAPDERTLAIYRLLCEYGLLPLDGWPRQEVLPSNLR